MIGTERRAGAKRGWAVVAASVVGVSGLVVGVWVTTNGSPDPTTGSGSAPTAAVTTSATAAPGDGPATDFALFPAGEVPVDITRSTTVDVTGAWPVPTCERVAADAGRVDFVSGTENGPEYSRDLAVGWYDGEAAAATAYDAVWAQVQACAASGGATVESTPADLGSSGVLATVAQPSVDGASDVAIYALTRVGVVVALTVDHASFFGATVPAPGDATVTLEQAERLVAELCQGGPARC